jgi:hypothetical protein
MEWVGMRLLALVLALVALSFSIEMVDPYLLTVKNGDTVELGVMGPGQTISVSFHRRVYEGGIHGIGGDYDIAYAKELPGGWKSKPSKLYGDPLQVTITAYENAAEGTYSVPVTIGDEGDGEKLGNITFTAIVDISNDVMGAEVSPSARRVGVGQPAAFEITIENRGNAGDTFRVSAEGVPKWSFSKTVYVPGMGKKSMLYEVAAYEEEHYSVDIIVESESSQLVRESLPVDVYVYPDVLSDYKAINNGALLFPIFEAPVYAFMGLLSNLW